jgi:protein-disulfide isomerase
MFCIVAFVILGIMGIFSATNRALAKEALDCVFRRITLRPCNTGFDQKMKAKILGSVITRSEFAARVISKNFELLAWVFFILTLGSSVWAVRGIYLFYVTGSCNGLNQSAFCVFDPKGSANAVSTVSASCPVKIITEKDLTLSGVDLTTFPSLNQNAKNKIVFIGCYDCDYSRKAYPMVIDLVNRFNVNLTFLHYPVKEKTDLGSRLGYCANQQDPTRFWQLNAALFKVPKGSIESDPALINSTLTGLGFDAGQINTCVNDPKTETAVQNQMAEITKTKFYGTPTVFINGKVLVGPKPYRVYAIMLEGLFYWLK